MINYTVMSYVLLFGLMVLVISGTYIYSLYNLYISRKEYKYKFILLSFNFLFLIVFIISLFYIHDYNQVPILILLILILAIIILGIIGGFMYEPNLSINSIDKYAKVTRRLKLVLTGIYVFVGTIFLYLLFVI